MDTEAELTDAEESESSPYEHLELTEYIRAFRSSADRVRWVTFIMTVFAAVIFVATWNGGESWMQHRYLKLRALQKRSPRRGRMIARRYCTPQ